MRLRDFIEALRAMFPDMDTNAKLRHDLAGAMQKASDNESASFTYEGVTYRITSVWKDGCLSGNCNPATCYTNWEIHNVD